MKASDFTENARVKSSIASLSAWRAQNVAVSDVIDDAGHQYVDLVMEGGGVLGVALLGYTYALESAGIRFMHLGGASAGSITAMLLAATGNKDQAKSAELVTMLADQNLREFMDGDTGARRFTNALLERKGTWRILWQARRVIDNFRDEHGLHPGSTFREWIERVIAERGVRDTAELNARIAFVPAGLRHRHGFAFGSSSRLALVTAEITTETKVEFPRMAHLFWSDPDRVNPSHYVRASMSVPFFFHPYRVPNVPRGAEARPAWDELAGYEGDLPTTAYFMDGGIVSNFPIHVFHRSDGVPSRPTFGVKLGTDRSAPHPVRSLSQVAGSVFNTARHALDYDFILRNPDYRRLVTSIETGDHNWLDFNLTDSAKIDLFVRGVESATRYLTAFDWEAYKRVRAKIADVMVQSRVEADQDVLE